MTFLKPGKKQTRASTSSVIRPELMEKDAESTLVGSNEQGDLLVKVRHGKKPVVLPNSNIDRIMECLVCSKPMYPPIQQKECKTHLLKHTLTYQCPSGHTLCLDCKSKVNNKCPVCRKEIGNIRCLVLEKLALSFPLTCRYHGLGCEKMLPYYSKVKHEAQCIFRPYSCPHPGSDCSIMGDVPTLLAHLRESHKVDLQTGSTFNHRYVKQDPCSVDSVSWTLTLFNCFDRYFCLHFEAFRLGTEPVYMAFLRFMGEESEASKFVYCLEVGGNGRKLTWQGVPRSIRTHHRSIRDSHDGLIIQRSLALYFSGGDRRELRLRVTGRIWKEL